MFLKFKSKVTLKRLEFTFHFTCGENNFSVGKADVCVCVCVFECVIPGEEDTECLGSVGGLSCEPWRLTEAALCQGHCCRLPLLLSLFTGRTHCRRQH